MRVYKSRITLNDKELKMQKGDVDIDNSGLNSMKYKIHSIDTIYNRHKLINVRFNES